MATLTISLTGQTPIVKTLSAGDVIKLMDAFRPILQENGIPSPTNQQLFEYWVDRWKADTITVVRNQRRAAAEIIDPPIVIS